RLGTRREGAPPDSRGESGHTIRLQVVARSPRWNCVAARESRASKPAMGESDDDEARQTGHRCADMIPRNEGVTSARWGEAALAHFGGDGKTRARGGSDCRARGAG